MKIIILTLGLIIGYFLNLYIYRLLWEEGLVAPSSHCLKYFTSFKYYGSILGPSFNCKGDKCRYCKERVVLQYLLVEALNGFTYLTLYNYFGVGLQFVFYAVVVDILIIVSVVDYYFQIIPDKCHIFLLISTFIYKLLQFLLYGISPYFLNSIIGLIVSSGIFLLIAILSKGGIGGGDIKLIGILGFILGFKLSLLNILISFFVGAFVSIFLIFFKIKDKKDSRAFGPFISLAFLITILEGKNIIFWYFNSLF